MTQISSQKLKTPLIIHNFWINH